MKLTAEDELTVIEYWIKNNHSEKITNFEIPEELSSKISDKESLIIRNKIEKTKRGIDWIISMGKLYSHANKLRMQIKTEKEIEYIKIQKKYLKKQQEFSNLQKKEISENSKNRLQIKNFTFILAFGVIISLFFYLFQIIITLKKSTTIHLLLISSIFTLIYALFIGFLFNIFDMNNYLKKYWKTSKISIIIIIIFILFFILLLFILPDFTV